MNVEAIVAEATSAYLSGVAPSMRAYVMQNLPMLNAAAEYMDELEQESVIVYDLVNCITWTVREELEHTTFLSFQPEEMLSELGRWNIDPTDVPERVIWDGDTVCEVKTMPVVFWLMLQLHHSRPGSPSAIAGGKT